MSQTLACPHCRQPVSIPTGLTGKKRVVCSICRRQFGIECSADTVRVFAIAATAVSDAAGTTSPAETIARPPRPWQYHFDFGLILSRALSHYGSAFLAALVFGLLTSFLGLSVQLSLPAFKVLMDLLGGLAGAILTLVIAVAVAVAVLPLIFGYLSACLSIARRKGWDLACFFTPYGNFGGCLMWFLALVGLGIVFAMLTSAGFYALGLFRDRHIRALLALTFVPVELIALFALLLRYFSLSPLFLIDGFDINQAVRLNFQVTSHWKWLYWLALGLLLFIIALVQGTIGRVIRAVTIQSFGMLWGSLIYIVPGTILSAIFSPLVLMPWVVAYVETTKQIRRKTAAA